MRFRPDALIAAFRFSSPEVKFSITGTRPKACRAKKTTTTPMDDGSRMPTRSPGCGHRRDLAPQHEGRADQAGVGEGLAVLVLQDFLVAEAVAGVDEGVEQGLFACLGVEAGPSNTRLLRRALTGPLAVRGRNLVKPWPR